MFNTFKFRSVPALALIVAVAFVGAADPALARKKKVHSEGMPHETVRKVQVRDHRNGVDAGGGGVVVTSQPRNPVIRDHRTSQKAVIRDHRRKKFVVGN